MNLRARQTGRDSKFGKMEKKVLDKTMKSWTLEEMLAERPCSDYTVARMSELLAGRESLSLLEILNLDIPDTDKIWVACRPGAFAEQSEWIDGMVERAIRKCAVTEPSTKEWAERWLSKMDKTAYAADAARAVADAARAAADAADAARAAYAADAARAARAAAYAGYAARAAAYAGYAARAAAYAGYDAEMKLQISELRGFLKTTA